MPLNVYLLPDWTTADDFADRVVVVIDILRATTTITQALSAGAREVIPCLETNEAQQAAQAWNVANPSIPAVLGGERGGRPIEGFDFGNSPADYTSASVGGKTLFFTTTNGTRAMQRCRTARRVLLGTFNNLSALVNLLRNESDIALLCAGTNGQITAEDVLFAGAVVDALMIFSPIFLIQNDEAQIAGRAWQEVDDSLRQDANYLTSVLLQSRGGRNLIELGMQADVAFAARIDTTTIVAELFVSSWRIGRLNAV